MPFDKYTAEIENWANAIEIVANIPEEGTRQDQLSVGDAPKFLVAVTSTPEGLRPPWLDVQINLITPSGRTISRGQDTQSTFTDEGESLIIIHEPDPGIWSLETTSRGQMPFAVNAASYHPSPVPTPPSMVTGFKCKACKTTAKALALSIIAAALLPAIPQALIAAVASYLGVGFAIAATFISSVLGDTADTIAEKLCKRIGLC